MTIRDRWTNPDIVFIGVGDAYFISRAWATSGQSKQTNWPVTGVSKGYIMGILGRNGLWNILHKVKIEIDQYYAFFLSLSLSNGLGLIWEKY